MSFLAELKRRKVFQVAVVYAVVAWLLVQIVATIEEPLSLPPWVDTLVIVLFLVGFPLAMVVSWAYDLRPDRTPPLEDPVSDVPNSGRNPADTDVAKLAVTDGNPLPNSVAVLPFENLSLDQKDAFFAVGIHESVLNELVKVGDLHVMARTSTLRYADGKTPISEIANELNVQTIVEGSVQYSDDRVRITAQLIDGRTGSHLWSEVYDRDFSDIFAVQTDIATCIAGALQAKLTPRERETLARRPTTSPEAYACYLRAIARSTLAGGVEGTPEESANYLRNLDDALAIDPDFALAHALKAREYAYSMARPIKLSDPLTLAVRDELAVENATRALTLEPDLALGYASLGAAHRFARRNADAVDALEHAFDLDPDDIRVLRDLAFYYLYRGRYERALEITERIVDTDPGLGFFILAVTLWPMGNLDGARTALDRLSVLSPNLTFMHVFSSWVDIGQEHDANALESLRVAERLGVAETGGSMILALTALAYRNLRHETDAARVFSQIQSMRDEYVITDGAWALACLAVNDRDQSLATLAEAVTQRNRGEDISEALIAFNMMGDPQLEGPDFVEVRKRLSVVN